MRRLAALALLAAVLAGCAHYYENVRWERPRPDAGYRFQSVEQVDDADSLFVCLSFSGGGTRAAALAYGVMRKLRDTPITRNGVETSLLDDVDCISSVSGGSFTAAYYALHGRRLFDDFDRRFLYRNIERELILRALHPVNWVRLASPYWGRIDLAAELYDETIFDGKTYAALAAGRRRPFVILNGTNLANGERFEFTQDQFDMLGSDLGPFPVARAVAASSAFPFLLSPITLVNHAGEPAITLPLEYTNALGDRDVNRRRYEWARHQVEYLDAARRPYVHLMDGGLADNIGLRAVMNAYQRSNGFIAQRIDNRIRRLVLIVVNAKTKDQEALSRRARPPGLTTVGFKTATISMDNYSFESIEVVKELLSERLRAQREVAACQKILDEACPNAEKLPTFEVMVRTCLVEVSFEAIEDARRRDYFLGLPTTFSLPKADVDALIGVGDELLDRSADFQRLLRSIREERALGEGIGEQGNCS